MLTILSFGFLICGFTFLLIFSSENTAGILIFALGFCILFPLAVLTAILSAALPLLSEFVPAAGEWSVRLQTYVDGGYGVPGLYYLIGSVLVLLIGSVYIADNDEDESDESDDVKSTTIEGDDKGQNEREKTDIDNLTDIGGIESEGAERLRDAGFDSISDVESASPDELTTVDGLDFSSAKELTSRLGGTTNQKNQIADTIGFENTSDESKSEAEDGVKNSDTKPNNVEKTEEEESENKAETGITAETHTQEESGSDEISDEARFEYSASRAGGQTETESESDERSEENQFEYSASRAGGQTETESESDERSEENQFEYSASRAGGQTETESESDERSDGDLSETSEYDELTNINGIDSTKAKELYQAGYESVDDLREARQGELANVVGSRYSSLIKTGAKFQNADGEVKVSQSSTTDKQGHSEPTSKQEDIDKEDIEHLLELPDVDRPKAESLYEGGFTRREDLQTATSSEIADIVGHGTMVSIREEVGFVDKTSKSNGSENEGGTSASSSNNINKSNQSNTPSSEFKWESDSDINDSESNSGTGEPAEIDQQLASDKQALISQLDDAISTPFQDTDSTREQLIRCHKQAAELGERAQELNAEDILSFVESTLSDIEYRLELLSDISESTRSARSKVSPDELPSDSIGLTDLESARDYYTTAVESANETEFDTAKLEQERAEIISAIEDRTEKSETSVTFTDSSSTEKSSSDDVNNDSDESPTREDLIEELTRLDDLTEGYPLTTDLREEGKYTQHDFTTEFGSWENALSAADINKRQRLIDDIHRMADIIGKTPNTTDMKEYSIYSSGTYSTTFGSWAAALEIAGLAEDGTDSVEKDASTESDSAQDSQPEEPEKQPDKSPSRAKLVEELTRLDSRTEVYPSSQDMRDDGKYSREQYFDEFESWEAALKAADIDKEQRLIDDIHRVADIVDGTPNPADIDADGVYSSRKYSNYFGSWASALEIAGLASKDTDDATADTSVAKHNQQGQEPNVNAEESDESLTRQELVAELTRLDGVVEGYPMTTNLREHGKYSRQPYYDEFDSWEEALKAADIDKEQRLINDIQSVAREIDGTPSIADMKKHGLHLGGIHTEYFGSWKNALQAAGIAKSSDSEHQTHSAELGDNQGSDTKTDHSLSNPDKQDYITAIQEYAQTTDNVLKSTDFKQYSGFSVQKIVAAFGSWQDALEEAGVDNKSRLLDELRRVAEKVGGQPSTGEMNEYGTISASLYSDYFESYTEARQQALSNKGPSAENGLNQDTRKQNYITAIQEYAQTTDDVIKSTDFTDYSDYSVQPIVAAFGSWQDALEEAGVDNKSRLLDEIHRVAEKVGHPPSTVEMNRHGTVSTTLYSEYFESYTKAREQEFLDHEKSAKPSDRGSSLNEYARIEDITEDGRLSSQIAVKVCYNLGDTSEKKADSLDVSDLDGNRCRLHIWRTHDIDMSWENGHWYVLTEPRGKQWTDKDNETKRQLSSTKDLQVEHIGDSPPTETNAIDSTSESSRIKSDTSQESTDTDTDNGDDVDDILNEIMTEFEDVSED